MGKFDLERLKLLPIDDVLSSLGLEPIRNGKQYACPYPHSKPSPVAIYSKTNTCKCFNCQEFGGDAIAVVQYKLQSDFKSACEFLHDTFSVPYLDGSSNQKARYIPKPVVKKEIEYIVFDEEMPYINITIKEHLANYGKMSPEQRLKMVYTTLYRLILKEKQEAKDVYYEKERGILPGNKYIKRVAYLSSRNISDVSEMMQKIFPVADLLTFSVFKERKGQPRFAFDYIDRGGLLFVPSFDLYNDLVTGFMVRPTNPPEWMRERGVKELQLSTTDIVKPLPFGLDHELVKEAETVYLTEGHPDLASIPGSCFGVASPGTHGLADFQLSLLRDKKVRLVYDQDFSGKKAEHGYVQIKIGDSREEFLLTDDGKADFKSRIRQLSAEDIEYDTAYHKGLKQKLLIAGVEDVEVFAWDKSLGGDLNDLLINGNIDKVFGGKS